MTLATPDEVTSPTAPGDARDTTPPPRPRPPWVPPPAAQVVGALAAIVALWTLAVRTIDVDAMSDIGLLSVLPATAFVALLLLGGSFLWALVDRRLPRWAAGAHVAVLATLIHGTPALLYGTIRYAWAYKHVGVVDYIQRLGAVDPTIDALGVYHNWPGFFALNAMLTSAGGFDTALQYAAWAPVFFNLLLIALVGLLARELLDDQRTVVTAAWLFVLTNWVGQDYFAPQALAYVWYLAIILIVLRWLGRAPSDHTLPTAPDTVALRLARWLPHRVRRIAGRPEWHDRLMRPADVHPTPRAWLEDPATGSAGNRLGLLACTLLLIWGVVSVHQLTPIALAVALTALFVGSRVSSGPPIAVGLLPLLTTVLTVEWLIDVAAPFMRDHLADATGAVGDVGANVAGTLLGYGEVSTGQVVVSLTARSLTVAVAVLFAHGVLRSARRERLAPAISLAVAPAALIAISGYGSEVLFRTYLFALPFLVIVAAAGLVPPRRPITGRSGAVLAGATLVLGGLLLFAYLGNDNRYRFTAEEVAAARYVQEVAPPNTLLIEGSRNYPAQFLNYERFTYVPIDREPVRTRQRIVAAPTSVLTEWMSNPDYDAAYVILTRSQKIETTTMGAIPDDGLATVERRMLRSPAFELVYRNDDASVFTLADRRTTDGSDR